MKFPCAGCGICCTKVDVLVDAVNNGALKKEDFPHDCDDTGRCEMLGEDNKCKVYDKRPLLCNIEAMFDHEDFERLMGVKKGKKKDYYLENAQMCNTWMKEEDYKGDLIDINKIK